MKQLNLKYLFKAIEDETHSQHGFDHELCWTWLVLEAFMLKHFRSVTPAKAKNPIVTITFKSSDCMYKWKIVSHLL